MFDNLTENTSALVYINSIVFEVVLSKQRWRIEEVRKNSIKLTMKIFYKTS